MSQRGVYHLLLKGLYMTGKRASDVAKKYLDDAENKVIQLQQQLETATKNYNDMKQAYNYVVACESNGYKNRITFVKFLN